MVPQQGEQQLSPGDLRELQDEVSISGILPWCKQYPPGIIPVSREGFKITDAVFGELLDLHQAILSMSVGWQNPQVEEAVRRYTEMHPGVDMVDTTQYSEAGLLLLRDMVMALSPYGKYRGYLGASGNYINDTNIRLCMGALGGEDNTQLVVMEGGYGGAGLMMNSVCEAPGWKGDLTSLRSRAFVVERDGSNADTVLRSVARAGKKPLWHTEDGQQGVGGFYPYDPALMRYLAEATYDAGGKKIYDEVQAFVRNGGGLIGLDRWGDSNNPKHRPDAFTFAKGLGNGRGVSAGFATEEVLEACKKGPGNTFDTNSQQTAGLVAAREVLKIVLEGRLWENMRKEGDHFKTHLTEVVQRFPAVCEAIIGEGGLIGIQMRTAAHAIKALEVSPKNKVVFAKGGMKGEVLRLPLPFNVTPEFVDEVSDCMEDVMKDVDATMVKQVA